MSYGLIDVREWSLLVNLVNGKKVDLPELGDSAGLARSLQEIISKNPYPGDFNLESIGWVTNIACKLNDKYKPHFMMLNYAQQYFLSRFKDISVSTWDEAINRLFENIQRFVETTGFTPIVVSLGGMVPLKDYIDLNNIDGLALSGGGSVYYSGLFRPSSRDLRTIQAMPGVERIISKREFINEFGGSPEFIRRFPDYLIIAEEGYTFKSYGSAGRPIYRIPAKCDEIPVYTSLNTDSLHSLTDIKDLIIDNIQSKRIALFILEAIGDTEFKFDYTKCTNKENWFVYTQSENQYLAITTGKHLQYNDYPPGYKYYIEDGETKKYPHTGPFVNMPKGTIGEELRTKLGLKSIAVGNRSVLTHMTSGADISVECLVRMLYNHGVLATINQD